MKKRMGLTLLASAIFIMGTLGASGTENALTLQTNDTGRILMKWDEFKKIIKLDDQQLAGAKAAAEKDMLAISWKEIQNLLGVEVKDVKSAEIKLPWKEFKMLLEWSVKTTEEKRLTEEKKKAELENTAPVKFLITGAEYMAETVSEDGALFTGKFKLDILEGKGWKQINLLSGDVAIRETKLPKNVFLRLNQGMYALMTTNSGPLEVEVAFSVGVTKAGGSYSLGFGKVESGTSVLDVTIPDKDADVKIKNAQFKLVKTEKGTRVVAALPATASILVSWERAVPEAEKVPPKIYSETRTLLSVADGLLLGRVQVNFNILHTATRQLQMNVPTGVSVLEVAGAQIRDWRAGDGKLTVQFDKEVIGSIVIDIKYETSLDTKIGKTRVPVITGSGVEREKGHIAVVALTSVEIVGDLITGAHAIDVKDLPGEIMGMTTQPILLAYRYVEPAFNVGLAIRKHADVDVLLTVVDRARFTTMQTLDGKRITRAIYNVRNNRNQFLRLRMPKDAEIWSASVAGKAIQPASDPEGRMLLPLVRSEGSGGMSAFPVELVFAEKGTPPDARGSGEVKVMLPSCDEPIMQLTVELYVPTEGKYRNFAGTLRQVESFTALGERPAHVNNSAPEDAQALQQIYVKKTPMAGNTPIEVQLPISGKIFRFEKILVLKDQEWLSYTFSGL